MTTMQSRRFDQCIEFTICCHPLPSSMKTVAMLDKGAEEYFDTRLRTSNDPKWKMEEPECRWDIGAQMDPHRNGVDNLKTGMLIPKHTHPR